jgi:alkylhydroperoxidase/carboxymuconolactone decarboxylase family protein YurZ
MQQTDPSKHIFSDKLEYLIAIGAAVAANCIPCFEHLYDKAVQSGSSIAEIQRAAEIAGQIKNGAHIALKNSINEIMDTEESNQQACSNGENKPCCC